MHTHTHMQSICIQEDYISWYTYKHLIFVFVNLHFTVNTHAHDRGVGWDGGHLAQLQEVIQRNACSVAPPVASVCR